MRALLSVYDKTGLTAFARGLVDLGWDLVSTGGTYRELSGAGLPVTSVTDVTDFPEMLDGRVKTLHPAIHGGILARRDDPDHLAQLDQHKITPIDLVVGNLYPFAATIHTPGVTVAAAIEQIDIGGPTLIRAAAKNFPGVVVVTDPNDYDKVRGYLADGAVPNDVRRSLAAKAFAHVSAYDALVAEYLRGDPRESDDPFPLEISIAGSRVRNLRYGENPHQRAAAYRRAGIGQAVPGVLDAAQLGGKELSFNNLVDADAAWQAVNISKRPTVSIVKHAIPCGLATSETLSGAFRGALAGDPISAFGGIVALNRTVDAETAAKMSETFFEVVIAPGFDQEALEILRAKPQLRVLELEPSERAEPPPWDLQLVAGGLLVQDSDSPSTDRSSWNVVTQRAPTPAEWRDLEFAWAAVRLVKSNAIVLVQHEAVIGVGSGQPNRLESVGIAVRRAGERVAGSVLAGDAFFPFPDGIETAAAAGVSAVVQPGGSIRDKRVIAAADAAGIAMVFTVTRHFRH